jgi:type IV pilus assembly protein PilC
MAGIDISNKSIKSKSTNNSKGKSISDILNADIKLFGSGYSDKKKESFYLELSILLSAGIDIKNALELVIEDQVKEKDKQLITSIKEEVVKGISLSETLKATGFFTDYEVFSIQIGEETGRVAIIMGELSLFYKNKIKQKRQAVSALTYPMIVLCTSIGVLSFMLNVIVPMFSDVFLRFGGELPYITQLVIQASKLAGELFWPMLATSFGIGIWLYTIRQRTSYRKITSTLFLRVPVLGELIRKIYLARFCHTMQLLISSKIPLLRALGLVKKMIGYYPIENSIDSIEQEILKGEPLHKALSKFAIYPGRLVSFIKVGEEVNRLDEFFEKINQQYSEEVDHQSKVLATVIEPIMMIFLGLIVGVILIAMYLPMFKMSTIF